MKFKKLACVLALGAVMSLGFAGCNSNDDTPATPTTTAAAATTTAPGGAATPAETTAANVEAPRADDESVMGRLMAANPVAQAWPLTTEAGPHFTLMVQIGGATVEDIVDNEFTHWYQEQTGVEINWDVLPSGMGQQIQLSVAAGDLPDGFVGNMGNVLMQQLAMLDGVLVPLTDYIFAYAPNVVEMLRTTPQARDISFMPDGNIYSFLRVYDTLNEQITKRAWVYEPWLELLGLDLPQTTEEFYDMLVLFRDEIPGLMGIPEVVPMAGALQGNPANNEPTSFLMNSFMFYPRGNYHMRVDGQAQFVANTEEYREGLRFMRRLVESNLLTTESWTINRGGLMAMTEGQAHGENIVGVVTAMYWGHFTTEGGPLGRDTSFVSVPVLEGPNGVRNAYDRGMLVNNGLLTVTREAQNVDLLVQWMDWLYDPFAQLEYGMSAKLGPEGVGWRHAEPGELTPFGEQATLAFLRPNDSRQRDAWFNVMGYWWPYEFTNGVVDDFMNRKESFGAQETVRNYLPWSAFHLRMPHLWVPFELLEEFNELSGFIGGNTGEVMLWQNQFIMGDACLDNDWDDYLAALDRLNITRLTEIWQIKLDAYYAMQG